MIGFCLQFFTCSLRGLIILYNLLLSSMYLRFLLFSKIYIPLISTKELCNSLFLLVNMELFLFIFLSKTSSSYTCLSNWFTFYALVFIEDFSATFSSFHFLGVGEGNFSSSIVTCPVRSTFALKIWPSY